MLGLSWAPDTSYSAPCDPPLTGPNTDAVQSASSNKQVPQADTAGLLAAACGDGVLRVWACPSVLAIDTAAQAAAGDDSDKPLVLDLQPLYTAALEGKLITAVDWCPTNPSVVLTGLSDGSCCIWKLGPPSSSHTAGTPLQADPWMHLVNTQVDTVLHENSAVRSVQWCPFRADMFASSGHGANVAVWCTTYPGTPLTPTVANTGVRLSPAVAWEPVRGGIWFTQADNMHYLHTMLFDKTTPQWGSQVSVRRLAVNAPLSRSTVS